MKLHSSLIALIGLVPLAIYCYNFHSYQISDDPEDWAFFGDYIGGVYSVILTCLLSYITYLLQRKAAVSKSRKDIIRELFSKINSLNSVEKPDIEEVNKLTKLVIDSEILFYNEKEYRTLLVITDYYKTVIEGGHVPEREHEIRQKLISMYNEYNNSYTQ